MFDLTQRVYLQVEKEEWYRRAANLRFAQAPHHPEPRHLSPIESAVFNYFYSPRTAKEIFSGWSSTLPNLVKRHCASYDKRLEDEALLCPPEAKWAGWRVAAIGALIIAVVGGCKLSVSRADWYVDDEALLILMGLGGLIVLVLACIPERLSRRGKSWQGRLQQAFEWLNAARIIPDEAGVTMSLTMGIFGVSALAGTEYAYFGDVFERGAAGGGGCGGGGGGGGGCGGCGGG